MSLFLKFSGYLGATFIVAFAVMFISARYWPPEPLVETLLSNWGSVAALALIPSIFVIGYAQAKGKNSIVFFCFSGVLVGLFCSVLPALVLARFATDFQTLLMFVAGFVFFGGPLGGLAGLTYWLIAGRYSRLNRELSESTK